MIGGPTFPTFEPAYRRVLTELRDQPAHSTWTRGKAAVEITNVSFTIADPRARTPYIAARKANIIFNHAEALWYLTGRDDLEMIAHYAPTLRKFSADGYTLTGTAYGPRLFTTGGADGRSQFDRVLALLRSDADSKRAAMIIMRPDELVDPANPDVACTLGLQFMLRRDRLHMSAYMRGNDAVVGMLGDIFAFTFIQEFAARLLGVEVGTYSHHVGSMHLNMEDREKVDAILAEPPRPTFRPVAMPPVTMAILSEVAHWEERLRANSCAFGADDGKGMHPYWRQVVALFEVHRQITQDGSLTPEKLDLLRPGHRWLIEQRWPSQQPTGVGR
uniref:Thymidylate synthase/dCMP hydroxymethylase domain-containing protein n=1 Tax=Pseudofrankia asymbiotica TaxID=1834516 RepID=A0A1V2I292_9ACTN